MFIPTIRSYGLYSSDNYGVNTLYVDFGAIRIYYSYKTIVAYYRPSEGVVVCENNWGTTTGKHLNWIDNGNKKHRLPYDEFQKRLEKALSEVIVQDV